MQPNSHCPPRSDLSVIVCTHNPRPDYLQRVLSALRTQTLTADRWELLLVDNLSDQPLPVAAGWPSSWRVVSEPRLGLTAARLAGIAQTAGPLLVFVDDDNVLAPDYLEQVLAIAARCPRLGVWGGNVAPVFEQPPPDWTRRYRRDLGRRVVPVDISSASPVPDAAMPIGAGLCVRRVVAQHYARSIEQSPLRLALGRRGTSLGSSEDTDLVLCAPELGLEHGLCACLHLQHLIPPARLTEDYLLALRENLALSSALLHLARGLAVDSPSSWPWRLKVARTWLRLWGRRWRFFQARRRGHERAFAIHAQSLKPIQKQPAEAAPTR